MASNRGRTKPELRFAKALWHQGWRYVTGEGYKRKRGAKLPGNPDLVFTAMRLVFFVDGCFWHGCPCKGGIPESSGEFWRSKVEGNVARDARVTQDLTGAGWTVVRVPEHCIRRLADFTATIEEADALLEATRVGQKPEVRRLKLHRARPAGDS
jgi:DNA mismatch endonuclease (patch repair protein)